MNDNLRASIVYIVSHLNEINFNDAVYDDTHSKYITFSGKIDKNHINITNLEESIKISGNLPGLVDHSSNSQILLEFSGTYFKGFDYATNTQYSGNIRGNKISIYDYEHAQHYTYSC